MLLIRSWILVDEESDVHEWYIAALWDLGVVDKEGYQAIAQMEGQQTLCYACAEYGWR